METTPISSPFKDKAPPRQLVGGSIIDYANMPIDHSKTLLGNRFLCRGAGMFIVAPSGQGKSTLAVQLAAEWALGWSPINISSSNPLKPSNPLRTLIIQGEDDNGDITEMSSWVNSHKLTREQIIQISRNTHIEPVCDVVGLKFIDALNDILEQWPTDILILNPYTSYLGEDVKDEKAANQFLREWLTPLLRHHNCAAIIMHHTPKTQYSPSADFTTTDFMYRGSGCASMTNWARAYLVFEPVPDTDYIFRFVAAKRGKRIGWATLDRYFRHSQNGDLRWVALPIEEEETFRAARRSKGNVAKVVDTGELLKLLPIEGEIESALLIQSIMEKFNVGRDRAYHEIKLMEANEIVSPKRHFRNNSSKSFGRPPIFYSRNDEKEEGEVVLPA